MMKKKWPKDEKILACLNFFTPVKKKLTNVAICTKESYVIIIHYINIQTIELNYYTYIL